MKKLISILLAVLFSALCLTACKGDGGAVTTEEKSTGTARSETAAADTEAVTEAQQPIEPEPVYRIGSDIVVPDYDTEAKIAETSVTKQFKSVKESGADFSLYENAKSNGATVIFPENTVSGVYPLQPAPSDSGSEYSFYLVSPSPRSDISWFTAYFGLRLESAGKDATGHNGLWIAMRADQIGLRYDWPNTGYMDADWNLTEGELVTVTDDPVNNVVKVYAGEEKRPIAEIRIEGANIAMYKPGADKPSVKDKVSTALPLGGYSHIWNHNTHVSGSVKDISATAVIQTVEPADASGIKPNTKDVFSDTYVTVDDTGRVIAYSGTKPSGAKVGMFYFLWHESSGPLWDHTKSYEEGGLEGLWKTMRSGSLGFAHYWAEPYFGYYRSNDEWVVRKHGAMLAEAGIDFVFFDATNGLLYKQCYESVLKVWSQMRKEGTKTPDVCFLMQDGNSRELAEIWNDLYSVGLYEDLWFKWNGKPVIMFTDSNNKLSKEQKEFFTVRISWADENDSWYKDLKGINCWAWGSMAPQKGGYAYIDGVKTLEQMVVMCGFWVNGSYGTNAGRSYTRKTGEPTKLSQGDWDMGYGLYPQTSGLGLAYQEQFDRAIQKSPKLIMITGWNEWWAGRWEGGGATGQTIANQYTVVNDKTKKEYNYYVDNLNPEYSRDIEPMKDGFKDNYYYQTVMNVRAYKGSRPVEAAFGQKTIDINGGEVQWLSVGPEFRDVAGDTAKRDFSSHVGGFTYKNDTGRNDIVTAKVSSDGEYLYFCVECAEDIVKADGANFMNLFINSDGDGQNGWYGFDYVINRSRDGKTASVERFKGGWEFEKAGDAEYVINGKVMTVKVSASLIGYNNETLDFKWADNSVDDGDIMGFWDKGDTAPDGRFSFRYTTKSEAAAAPECLTADMAVFKVNGYNAYIGGKQVRLIDTNTKATLLASGHEFWLPVSVLKQIGVDCKDLPLLDHYGVEYVKADEAVKASGKAVTVYSRGLVVISDKAVTDTEALDILYDSLY